VTLITLGGGIALIILLTFLMIVCVEKNSPSMHMLEAVGRANVEPLPEPTIRFKGTIQDFPDFGLEVEVVVTPLSSSAMASVGERSLLSACM